MPKNKDKETTNKREEVIILLLKRTLAFIAIIALYYTIAIAMIFVLNLDVDRNEVWFLSIDMSIMITTVLIGTLMVIALVLTWGDDLQ